MIDVYALGYHHSYYDLETYFQVKKKKRLMSVLSVQQLHLLAMYCINFTVGEKL